MRRSVRAVEVRLLCYDWLSHGLLPELRDSCISDVKNAQERPGVEPVWDGERSPRDEAKPPGTSGLLRGITGDWFIYVAVAAVAVVVGIVNALSMADDIARRGGVYDIRTPLLWDMTSIAVIILLTPVLLAIVRRIRREPALGLRIGARRRHHRRLFGPAHHRHGGSAQTDHVARRRRL